MLDLATTLRALPEQQGEPPWPGHPLGDDAQRPRRDPDAQRMESIDQTSAVLDGVDLGRATRVSPNPQIGQVPLPARGVLAIGQGAWQIPNVLGGTS